MATDSRKRFTSFASFNGSKLLLKWVADGTSEGDLYTTIASVSNNSRTLLALDAPLGWPEPLGDHLANHLAGDPLCESPNKLFRRATDDFIKDKIDKRPLDVGADRIARTAYAALALLSKLSKHIQYPVSLAWESTFDSIAAIEVYPAATLIAHGQSAAGYKGKDGQKARATILSWLTKLIDISVDHKKLLVSNDNALDSVMCVLAGCDFLLNRCYPPTNLALAKKEGWIWVYNKE